MERAFTRLCKLKGRKNQEKSKRPRIAAILSYKVRVGLAFNNLKSLILKIGFNML
ncbi:hypothetical protein MTR_7g037580 [Medicago truncatula]|uniref:Uncharacterized protein n=1 Tax=Medicago truncatula TaxID=3880 RepID=G7KS33_MEDTR|nr:hypothetical protein MTR_7g037580 [Medicago truncatula]